MSKLWNLNKDSCTHAADLSEGPGEDGLYPINAVSRGGKLVAVHRGDLKVVVYAVNGTNVSTKETRDVAGEIKA